MVLAHGLYGAGTDMDQIGDCLHEKFKDGVLLLKANSYEGEEKRGGRGEDKKREEKRRVCVMFPEFF